MLVGHDRVELDVLDAGAERRPGLLARRDGSRETDTDDADDEGRPPHLGISCRSGLARGVYSNRKTPADRVMAVGPLKERWVKGEFAAGRLRSLRYRLGLLSRKPRVRGEVG